MTSLVVTPSTDKEKSVEKILFDNFFKHIAKIIACYNKKQRELDLDISKKGKEFLERYRKFIQVSRDYDKAFYPQMFSTWANSIIEPNLIWENPILFSFINGKHQYEIVIDIPMIQQWALSYDETKLQLNGLEFILLNICALYHRNDKMVEELKERIEEMTPKPAAVSSPLGPLGNLDLGNFQQMFGKIIAGAFNAMKANDPEGAGGMDGEEFAAKIQESNVIGKVADKMKSGELVTGIMKGDYSTLQNMASELMQDEGLKKMMSDLEGKPQRFDQLPKEIQPPGSPLGDVSTAQTTNGIGSSSSLPTEELE